MTTVMTAPLTWTIEWFFIFHFRCVSVRCLQSSCTIIVMNCVQAKSELFPANTPTANHTTEHKTFCHKSNDMITKDWKGGEWHKERTAIKVFLQVPFIHNFYDLMCVFLALCLYYQLTAGGKTTHTDMLLSQWKEKKRNPIAMTSNSCSSTT